MWIEAEKRAAMVLADQRTVGSERNLVPEPRQSQESHRTGDKLVQSDDNEELY